MLYVQKSTLINSGNNISKIRQTVFEKKCRSPIEKGQIFYNISVTGGTSEQNGNVSSYTQIANFLRQFEK